jgi:hypothetical protein
MRREAWAERAYDSYAATLGWHGPGGGLLPTWMDLPEAQREAWRAAVETVQEEAQCADLEARVAAGETGEADDAGG